MQPILSIIIPVYNVQDYIEPCIDSILANKHLDKIEIILVNDGSTDDSVLKVHKYTQKYPNIKLFIQKNGGPSSARNYGIDKANGKWLWFIDSDDCISSESIEIIINQISEYKDTDIFIFRYKKFKEKIPNNIIKSINSIKFISKKQAMKTLLDFEYASFAWNKLYRSKLFDNIRFPIGRNYEDMSIMYKLYDKAQRFMLVPIVLYYYRQVNNSIVHTKSIKNLKDSATAHYEMYEFMYKNYPKLAIQLEKETTVNVVSYFHRLSFTDIKNAGKLYSFLKHTVPLNEYNIRYKIELFTFKYCYPAFKIIGLIGKAKRKIKS